MSETQSIEYKSSWRDEYLKWICGFANAQGGALYIGKDDDGKIVGVDNAKKLMEDIPNKIRDILGIVADVNLHKTKQGDYIEIVVEACLNPVNYKGEYHYRSGNTKQELKGAALNRFLLERTGRKWDGVPVANVSIDDLSLIALQRFRKEAARSGRVDEYVLHDSTEHLLQDLQLIDLDSGNIDNSQVRQLLNVSKPTATRLLKQMEEWLIMKNAGRNGVVYYLKWAF